MTDDAGVTAAGKWHFEYANTFADLPKNASPNLRQDASNFVVQYGLCERLEVNVDFPLIYIQNAPRSSIGDVFGLGDVDFAAKWNLVSEEAGRTHPAFTFSAAIEIPTGSEKKQLGSGIADYLVNLIVEKSVGTATVVHGNAGVQFAGNTATGAVGIRTPGVIYSAGLSMAHDFSSRIRLGLDLNAAEVHDGGPLERQIQLTAGGSWAVLSQDSVNFAVLVGWDRAPRAGVIFGFSLTP